MMFKRFLSVILAAAMLLSVIAVGVFSAGAVTAGDADRDGQVSVLDATCIQKYLAKIIGEEKIDLIAALVTGEEKVTVLDATRIQKFLAKIVNLDGTPYGLEPQSIAVYLSEEPYTLDPALNSETGAGTILTHLFSGLARYEKDDDGTLLVVPDAAQALPEATENQNGTYTYTYTIRNGMKWSDGKDLTAYDFEFAWQRAASPALYADYSYLFEVVDGYDDIWATDDEGYLLNPDAKLNIKAVDNKTFEVTLTDDVPYWNELLAFPTFFPVREDVASNENWASEASTYVCNGAYTLSEWSHDDKIVISKNRNYPNANRVTMDTIEFGLSVNYDTLMSEYDGGKWQLLNDFADESLQNVKEKYGDELHIDGQLGTYYLGWNINRNLLPAGSGLSGVEKERENAEIRKAISLLIERNVITNELIGGGQTPASSFVAMGTTDADGSQFYQNAGHSEDYCGYYDVSPEAYESNIEEAVKILFKYYNYDVEKEAFTNVPALTYVYNDSPGHAVIADFIATTLGSIGIEVDLEGVPWDEFLNDRKRGDFTIARNGWIADFNDPISFLDMWTSYSGNNDVHFGVGAHRDIRAYSLDLTPYGYDIKVEAGTWAETYDQLIRVIKSCKEKETRYQLMHLAEDMLMDTGCITPLYFYTNLYLLSSSVDGFFSTPLGLMNFMYCTVK